MISDRLLCKGLCEGVWIYGYYFETNGNARILDTNNNIAYGIDPATVGQYTGLTDKNGTKIFEGDIVKIEPVKHKEEIQIQGRNYKISELKGCWIMLNDEEKWEFLGSIANSVVVVGNIHDNPELLAEVRE